jgi:DNA-binding LacI/PurR family transcriptional regulator
VTPIDVARRAGVSKSTLSNVIRDATLVAETTQQRVERAIAEAGYGADPDRRPVLRHRVVDTLGKMLRAGTITQEMHDAARDLQANFIIDPARPAAGGADPARSGHRSRA